MIEPQNDEERTALRLGNEASGTDFKQFAHEDSRNVWMKILSTARAIFREEQRPSELNECTNSELFRVRDEIRLRSEVLRAYFGRAPSRADADDELSVQWERFQALLRRERELMGREWVTT